MSDEQAGCDPFENGFSEEEVRKLYKDEITRLRADLAAVTAERDRLREALAAEKALTNACERVNRRNDELLDQVRALREALKPFADDGLHEGLGDGPDDERTHWPSFLLGDLRRARAALECVTEPASPWRDIESAPRDGSVFLAINNRAGPDPKPKGYNPYFLCFCLPPDEGVNYASDAGWRSPGRDWPVYPTDWMPIPIPIPPR